ncbi:Uncharacterized protein Adt_31175 [Abeliophyllum distichum]|uniref:Uncharacterized protein n=1 Tax=Abeliophyllum distichum TaxID=126358 RepID=A0ABD1REF4_9LAMI
MRTKKKISLYFLSLSNEPYKPKSLEEATGTQGAEEYKYTIHTNHQPLIYTSIQRTPAALSDGYNVGPFPSNWVSWDWAEIIRQWFGSQQLGSQPISSLPYTLKFCLSSTAITSNDPTESPP